MKTILISGQQGTGKTLLIEAIKSNSQIIHDSSRIMTKNVFAYKNFITSIKNEEKVIIDGCYPHNRVKQTIEHCNELNKDIIIISNQSEHEFLELGIRFNLTFGTTIKTV